MTPALMSALQGIQGAFGQEDVHARRIALWGRDDVPSASASASSSPFPRSAATLELSGQALTQPGGADSGQGRDPAVGAHPDAEPPPLADSGDDGNDVDLAAEMVGTQVDATAAKANMASFRTADRMLGDLLDIVG